MKTFSSEFLQDYGTYSFGYCNYAVREKGDRLSDIYSLGYLPYSGKLGVKDTFYMARSARVDVKKFSPSSENRRILKKFDGTLNRVENPIKKFEYRDKDFITFCTDYFAKRHGKDVMPKGRLLNILDMGLVSNIASYEQNGETVAYVFEVSDKDMTHFWSSFYDLSLIKQSLGMWLMLDSLRAAREAKRKYFYAGTVYGEKALYKANLAALEYWNGNEWIPDVKKLKARARSDTKRVVAATDEWKGLDNL